jgi:D-alanyl-D-alanine carboxypeptidase
VTADLPIVGRARCHRAVVAAVGGALAEVVRANLASLVDRRGFGGCWNPRMTRAGSGLSRHAWGVAVDLNTGDNPTGFASVQDPRLVDIFRRWGLTSGGDWLVPDAGHFEFVAPPAP